MKIQLISSANLSDRVKFFLCLFIFCFCAPSCVSVDSTGRRWVSIPTPGDPLCNLLLDALSGKLEKPPAPTVALPVSQPKAVVYKNVPAKNIPSSWIAVKIGQVPPPPVGFVFSVLKERDGSFLVRATTGPSKRMSKDEYKDFVATCDAMKWKTQMYELR